MLSMGASDSEGEDWPPVYIYRGQEIKSLALHTHGCPVKRLRCCFVSLHLPRPPVPLPPPSPSIPFSLPIPLPSSCSCSSSCSSLSKAFIDVCLFACLPACQYV